MTKITIPTRYSVSDSNDRADAYAVCVRTPQGLHAVATFPAALQTASGASYYHAREDAKAEAARMDSEDSK